VVSSPVSAARAANSVVHNRSLDTLDPPESAVISSGAASGYPCRPTQFHQRRRDSTANAPVPASVPTLTQPVFAVAL
jgi:hypothetical protein